MIELAIETAKKLRKKHLKMVEFIKLTGISRYRLYIYFPGGWAEVCRKAGLEIPCLNRKIPDDTLIEEFHRVANEWGGIPAWAQIKNELPISIDTFLKRFGGKQGFLERYKNWLLINAHDSKILELVFIDLNQKRLSKIAKDQDNKSHSHNVPKHGLGKPIKFRGISRTPANESGVVILFGMICQDLGFVIEAMNLSFPDCEAKMCTDPIQDKWEIVLIEFEYRSKNFLWHKHDHTQCDMIVCWEHNWPDCPIKVLELKKEIGRLRA
jgi:hypothetical protein